MDKKRSLFFDTSLIYFIVILCFIGVRILSSSVHLNTTWSEVLNVSIQVVFMFGVPFVLYMLMRKKRPIDVVKDFNIKKISFKAVLITIGIGLLVYAVNLAVASFFNIFINATGYDPNYGMEVVGEGGAYPLILFFVNIFVTGVLPGICEEFCHRGMLINGYKQLGLVKTILLTGLLFGLMHLNVEQFFYASIMGFFFGLITYLTGSIIPAMIVHFMNNSIGVYLTFASANNLPFGDLFGRISNAMGNSDGLIVFLAIIFVVTLVIALLIGLIFALLKETRIKDIKKLALNAIKQKERETLLESFDIDAKTIDSDVKKDENSPVVVFSNNHLGRNNLINISMNGGLLHGDNRLRKPSLKDKCFLYGTVFIGVFITISTLIWGII